MNFKYYTTNNELVTDQDWVSEQDLQLITGVEVELGRAAAVAGQGFLGAQDTAAVAIDVVECFHRLGDEGIAVAGLLGEVLR